MSRYTKKELVNCLEQRLKWYERSIEMANKGFYCAGYNFPDGNVDTWKGAVRELRNTINMLM